MNKEYWIICIEDALDNAGVSATVEQITEIAAAIEAAREMEGEATGSRYIPHPLEAEKRELQERLKRQEREAEQRLAAVEGLALRARGLRSDQAYVNIDRGTANFERRG